jgi:hypothetical protein
MEIYTNRDIRDGNVGIGKLSSPYLTTLEDIASEYVSHIPDKTATTHHTYYTDLEGKMRTNFEKIQFAEFWQGLRVNAFENSDTFAASLRDMVEMNEIYYSNPKPNFEKGLLYGAAANLIPHRDCILFYFPGIRVYRVIIGATDGNSDTVTEFITHGVEMCLNKGDYMVFDFDRTLHRVKKTGQTPTPRILLKLHFLTCDMDYVKFPGSMYYIDFAYLCYVVYYRVARYTEQLGTDPKTFVGFFFGILWEYPFYPKVIKSTTCVYLGVVASRCISIGFTNDIEESSIHFSQILLCKLWNIGNIREVIAYSTLDMILIYLCIVTWFYVSFLFSQRKTISSIKEDK